MMITQGEIDKIEKALEIGSKAIDRLQSELKLKDDRIKELESSLLDVAKKATAKISDLEAEVKRLREENEA